ncbi:PadR family transcriptional regulator [Pseudarthrobacter sp. L1SW]|uniref:PadR family transcriptional regulator n=1 Tax=Pseudarthrobacter sp. L1SW TaxID=2851598 RepID=UPI001E3FB1D7|nr:PadR family transcriptional regulator [Pseudarthrobacter sp. L1SW]UEL27854.1 PadR family transcriptional regulator [Pseudarthrobacter sp. L1SW]
MSSDKRWPSDWVRAVLPTCILQAIAGSDDAYGYRVIQVLRGAGFDGLSGGTLYPALNRLETDGFVSSEWREGDAGPGKKFYSLTPEGRQRLHESARDWNRFSVLIMDLLEEKKAH